MRKQSCFCRTGRWRAEAEGGCGWVRAIECVGKTFVACALAHQACRYGASVLYFRLPKTDLLVLDDWGLAAFTDVASRDLLEIFDDRHELRSTLVTSRLRQR